MRTNKSYIRDIDVFDGDKLVGTIYNAKSYNDAITRSQKELKLPLLQSGYEYRNTVYRTGKLTNNNKL